MPRHFPLDQLPPLTDAQLRSLSAFLAKPPVFVELNVLAKKIRAPRAKTLAIFIRLSSEALVEIELTVYHGCSVKFVTTRLMKEGFQPTPWTCPCCRKMVDGPDDLKYDFRARFPFSIVLD